GKESSSKLTKLNQKMKELSSYRQLIMFGFTPLFNQEMKFAEGNIFPFFKIYADLLKQFDIFEIIKMKKESIKQKYKMIPGTFEYEIQMKESMEEKSINLSGNESLSSSP